MTGPGCWPKLPKMCYSLDKQERQPPKLHLIKQALPGTVTNGDYPGPGQSKVVIYCLYSVP